MSLDAVEVENADCPLNNCAASIPSRLTRYVESVFLDSYAPLDSHALANWFAAILNMRQEADGLSAFARKAGQIRRNQPVFGSVAPILPIKRSILRIADWFDFEWI